MNEKPSKYKIELTEHQLRILSFVRDKYPDAVIHDCYSEPNKVGD